MKYFICAILFLVIFSCRNPQQKNHLNFSEKLTGKWQATAFSGELHETWQSTSDGWLVQQGFYIENRDTSYSANTKIEKVAGELILFSVIKNSNPKIFQAIKTTPDSIVFENTDYKNPYRVKYEFLGATDYRRTITGYEQDSLVTYIFDFEKAN